MVRMIFVERGFRIAVAAALLVGGALCAGADEAGEPVATPVLASAGYINGAMNIAVEYREGTEYEVEMQAEGEGPGRASPAWWTSSRRTASCCPAGIGR